MGNTGSFEENLQRRSANINELHTDIDLLMSRVNNEANRIIDLINQRGYTDRNEICRRIGYQKIDELSDMFPIQTLNGIRYRLGIIPEPTAALESNKQRVCLDIVNFYLKKVNLINNIQNELPKCREMEQRIYDGLTEKLSRGGLQTEEWLEVYNRLEKFNKEIRDRYELFERELERVRAAQTMSELDNIAVTTNNILSKTNTICRNYENELVLYSGHNIPVRAPIPAEPVRPQVALPRAPVVQAGLRAPPAVVAAPAVAARPTFAMSPSLMSPPALFQRKPQVSAQLVQPSEVRREIIPSALSFPTSPVQSPAVSMATSSSPAGSVVTTTQTVDPLPYRVDEHRVTPGTFTPPSVVTGQTIVDPKSRTLTTQDIFRDAFGDPHVISQRHTVDTKPHLVTTNKVLPGSYTPPVVETTSRIVDPAPTSVKTTHYQPGMATTTPSVRIPITTQPTFVPQPTIATTPVTTTTTTTVPRVQQTTVVGERLVRDPLTGQVSMAAPSRVDVTRTVTAPEAAVLQSRLQPSERFIKIERATPPMLPTGVGLPMRALATYVPLSSNELAIVPGQEVIYLGESSGWALIQSNFQKGYVPKSYLAAL